MKKIYLVFLLIFTIITLNGQTLFFTDFNTDKYPNVTAKFYLLDSDGNQVTNYGISDYEVIENGVKRSIIDLSCPPEPEDIPVSVAMSIDISGSMIFHDGYAPVDYAKMTARVIAENIDIPPSEIALQTCNDYAMINLDFTQDKKKYFDALKPVKAGGGNNFVEHLLNSKTGLLNIAKRGVFDRNAVIYTDAYWPSLSSKELNQCIDLCVDNGITFYAAIYSREDINPNGIKSSLQKICDATGGILFDDVTTETKAKEIAHAIKLSIKKAKPCEIEWLSDYICNQSKVKVQFRNYPMVLEINEEYETEENNVSRLQFDPTGILFGSVEPVQTVTEKITVTSINSDAEITDIIPSNPNFSVTPKSFSLAKDESKELTVTYQANDSLYNFCSFDVISNPCNGSFFATAGFSDKPNPVKTLRVVHPNGGERFILGQDSIITWEGVAPSEKIHVSYSHNNGEDWVELHDGKTDLKYDWLNIPMPESDECLARVAQRNGELDKFEIIKKLENLGGKVMYVEWSPDGKKIAISTRVGGLFIYNAEDYSLSKTLTGHSGSIQVITWSPDGKKLASSCWDGTIKIWDSNTGIEIRNISDVAKPVSIEWSPDGKTIAVGSWEGNLHYFNSISGDLIKTISAHTSNIRMIDWNPNGEKIVTASYDGTAKIWDTKTYLEILEYNNHTDKVDCAMWNSSGDLVVSTGHGAEVLVWDAKTGNTINNFTGHTDYVSSVAWSPDSKYIASAGKGSEIIIWNLIENKKENEMNTHSDLIHTLDWHSDGTKLLSGSWDKSVIVWNMIEKFSQIDTSDNVFSIVKPEFTAKNIDMKEVLVNTQKDSLIHTFISNSKDIPVEINNIKISGNDANQFKQIGGFAPFILDPGETIACEFSFKPTSVGPKNALIDISTNVETVSYNIIGVGVKESAYVFEDLIDFGKVHINRLKDSLVTAIIKNVGNKTLNVTDILNNGPDSKQFFVVDNNTSFSLKPGEERNLTLRFYPNQVGLTSGSILFVHDGFGSPSMVRLLGEGINLNPEITTNSPICAGDDLKLYADSIPDAVYNWNGPNNFKSHKRVAVIENAQPENSGIYTFFAEIDGFYTDTSQIEIKVESWLVSPGDSSLIFVGNAQRLQNDEILLTESKKWDGGSIWLRNRFSVLKDFETTFSFKYSDGVKASTAESSLPGADGIAFVMQNHNFPVLGDLGGSIGYTGITNSMAVEIDLFKNPYDPNGNHIAVQSMEDKPNSPEHSDSKATLAINTDIPIIKSDMYYNVKIEYLSNTQTFNVYLDSTGEFKYPVIMIEDIDLVELLNLEDGEYVYLGITAGTGEEYQKQVIKDWMIPCNNQLIDTSAQSIKYMESNSEIFNIYPNPTDEKFTVSVDLENASNLSIYILDIFGNKADYLISNAIKSKGNYLFSYNSELLSSGIYYIIVQIDNYRYIKQLQIVR